MSLCKFLCAIYVIKVWVYVDNNINQLKIFLELKWTDWSVILVHLYLFLYVIFVITVTLNIFFDLSICKTILNFTICLVEFCAGINMQMN
jgi:hypothetical protein